jgi:hypothetical protein
MPALWPKFIVDLASEIASQNYTRPGGAIFSYPLPTVGTDQVPIFPPTGALIKSITPGNPVNSILTTNPLKYINVVELNPLSGRYDFGVKVAELYIKAVKNYAATHMMATHTNNPAAELILKQGYGIAFERLLKEGDIPLQDQLDENGNIVKMGKESHPAYAEFNPDPAQFEVPPQCDILEDANKAFDKFIEEKKSDLHRFTYHEFPCLDGNETQEELKQLFATRLLMRFEKLQNPNKRWEFFQWVDRLGNKWYKSDGEYNLGPFDPAWFQIGSNEYPNIHTKCREDIEAAGYNWQKLANDVSGAVTYWILEAHTNGNTPEQRVKQPRTSDIQYPEAGRDICKLNEWKCQVSWDREHLPPETPSKRPKVLTDMVVATFSWVEGYKKTAVGNVLYYKKDPNWVEREYVEKEYERHWIKIPESKLKAASESSDPAAAFLAINPDPEGTLFKFEHHRALCAKKAADACEEEMEAVDHPWEDAGETPGGKAYSGDPYMMMARVTIAYWYACIVKPFKPMPAAPPAVISPPLTGIYIPIYYGSANRLANRLRKAWNTGKVFSVLPAPQPPALATATAVAAVYALHLLEFKLIYLGGIPTPVGPVPMVGFVPIVF